MAENDREARRGRGAGKGRGRLRDLGLAAAGLLSGLALAEVAFWYRDRGAFAHLNVYEADPKLGVRLEPLATTRVALPGNPVTGVRINAAGLRGELPPLSGNEVAVVGDSQVFGLGVEEHETMSAELGRLLGAPVVNAGVPTYGPPEYEAVVERLLRERGTKTIVYVVNFSNDLFEARRPNTERHAVWDGWAVRKETAPASVVAFPGRRLLFGRSHLFYAARSLWYRLGPPLDEQGLPSEGTVHDLLDAGAAAVDERRRAEQLTAAKAERHAAEIEQAVAAELRADLKVEKVALGINEVFAEQAVFEAGARRYAYRVSRDNPGDIVYHQQVYSEESRSPPSSYAIVLNGAKVRREVEAHLRALAEKKAKEAEGQAILATLEEREALRARVAALRAAPAEIVRAWSPMTEPLRRVKALCDGAGARLVVVALPIDAQVSKAESKKYGGAEVDMGSTTALLDDLVESAEALGALAVNALPALARAEPGAFLPNDLHMTPKGQAAVARAIAERLAATRPAPPGAPEKGRL